VGDLGLRGEIFSALEVQLAQGSGDISSNELASFDVAREPRRLFPNSEGIWNRRDLEATLSVGSSADGPYADEEISPRVWHCDYEAG